MGTPAGKWPAGRALRRFSRRKWPARSDSVGATAHEEQDQLDARVDGELAKEGRELIGNGTLGRTALTRDVRVRVTEEHAIGDVTFRRSHVRNRTSLSLRAGRPEFGEVASGTRHHELAHVVEVQL